MASTVTVFRMLWMLMALTMSIAEPVDFSSKIETFSGKFYKEVASQNRKTNVIMSPLSADLALTMVGLGCAGKTLEQIEHTLGLNHLDDILEATKSFIDGLSTIRNAELVIANKVFPKKYANPKLDAINSTYREEVVKYFHSEVEQVDFSKSREAAAEINEWVESKTNHRIKNLIASSSLDSMTAAVLVSAIYFKGAWAHTFAKDETKQEDFTLADGSTVKVDMMHTRSEYWFQESKELDAKIINLPYKNREIVMTVILPNKIDGLDALEDKLLKTGLTNYLNDMKRCDVILSLPKSIIETTINLKDVLTKLGTELVFSNNAEITGILNGVSNLYVSEAIQKAFIEINEEGSEAAAASVFGMQLLSGVAWIPPLDIVYFNASHPYYFAIMKSGTILFEGNKRV